MRDMLRVAAVEDLSAMRAHDEMLDLAIRIGRFAHVFDGGLDHGGANMDRRSARSIRPFGLTVVRYPSAATF